MCEFPDKSFDNGTRADSLWRARYVGLVAAIIIVGVALHDSLALRNLASYEAQLRAVERSHPVLALVGAFAVYVLLTGLSLPVATLLTLFYGWFFGFLRGLLLVSFASTAGATLAMLLSRYLLRDFVQNCYGHRLKNIKGIIERDGSYVLFMLCLVPTIPFVVINAVMGLTSISAWKFWWVSQLGMLSGTVLYVYVGTSVPSLQVLSKEGLGAIFSIDEMARISVALTLVGIFPLVVRWTVRSRDRSQFVAEFMSVVENSD